MLLCDREIKVLVENRRMISPFVPELTRQDERGKVISYGLSSFGYDIRCTNEFHIFERPLREGVVVDPKNFEGERIVRRVVADYVDVPPNTCVLSQSVEYMQMPPDVTGVCLSKSTYVRAGLLALMSPLEAGWRGTITLEFANTSPLPVRLYANEGCAQVLFFKGAAPDVCYSTRKGKYDGQSKLTWSKV